MQSGPGIGTMAARTAAALVFLGVLACAGIAIGVLFVLTWVIRIIVGIADDPNAGPYRQVR